MEEEIKKHRKIAELGAHCGECPDCISSLCNEFCSFENEKTPLCEQPRFLNLHIEDYETIEDTLTKEAEIEKKDKVIDEMAEYIAGLDTEEDICVNTGRLGECDSMAFEECENCIKDYFERKVEND